MGQAHPGGGSGDRVFGLFSRARRALGWILYLAIRGMNRAEVRVLARVRWLR